MKKELKDMTEKEILRQQLELLAEVSKESIAEELPAITEQMINITYCLLSSSVDSTL